jgi:HEXXH motif-containing protein
LKLNERRWIYAAGLTPEWRWAASHRSKDAALRLRGIAAAFRKSAPKSLSPGAADGLRYFLKRDDALRGSWARHPAVDYWLFLWDQHFTRPCAESDWALQMSLFSGLAAALALARGDRAAFDLSLDPEARLCLYGSHYFFEYPAALALKTVRVEVRGGGLAVLGPGKRRVELSRERLKSLPPEGLRFGEIRAGRSPELAPGMIVEDRAWLLMRGVNMHGLAHFKAKEKARFIAVLQDAIADLARKDPDLLAEMTDLVRLIVPLENPMNYGSVSSSYVNMRGAICLSHSEDVKLQAETLIHEFSHQKLNQLMIVEPILLAGQSGQVFYSPWRKDARRLRGLLLGAHAFLNVARYYLKSVSRESFRREENLDSMVNVASRLFQIESALRSVSFYGTFTEFGRSFQLGLWRELGLLFHAIQWFPTALVQEARDNAARHRAEHALFDTGFHKSVGFVDKAARAPFLTPGGAEKPLLIDPASEEKA